MRHSPHSRSHTLKQVATALILGHSLGLTGLAHATDSAAAAAAVARLLALPLPGSESAAPAADTAKRATANTLRGENLDRVIRRVMPQQPFKDDFVRKAFVRLNPDILGKNPTRMLPAGTALQVPNPQDMAALLSEHYPVLDKTAASEDTTTSATSAKRRWVQFP
jgi:hypothetical protein